MEQTVPSATTARPFAFRLTLDSELALAPELGRLAAGLAVSAFYGLALGARAGGGALVENAVGVPLALAVLCAVMMPSLTVLFAILDAPVSPGRVLASLGRALASVGLVLAGLAPGAVLLVVSVESGILATAVAVLGFVLAGGIGLVQLMLSLVPAVRESAWHVRWKAHGLLAAYAIFAISLGARLFELFVPMLGGAS